MAAIQFDKNIKNPQEITPDISEKDRKAELKNEMKELKQQFRQEEKDKRDAMKATRQALKQEIKETRDNVKMIKLTVEDEKDLLQKEILNLQIKFLKKYGEGPLDLFTEYQNQLQ